MTTYNSEHNQLPACIVVHNPYRANSLRYISDKNKDVFLYTERPDPEIFSIEHEVFCRTIEANAVTTIELTELLKASPYVSQLLHLLSVNPNQVYTRDALITFPWAPDHCLISVMKEPVRRVESIVMREAARLTGLREIVQIPQDIYLEGGDTIPIVMDGRRFLLTGYGRRTSEDALYFLQKHLIPDYADAVFGIKLADWRINLDGGLVPVSSDLMVCHPDSLLSGILLTKRGEEKIADPLGFMEEMGCKAVTVTREESVWKQSCNILCLSGGRLVMYDLSPDVENRIRAAGGIDIFTVSGKELVKGRGGCRCMSRPVYKDFS